MDAIRLRSRKRIDGTFFNHQRRSPWPRMETGGMGRPARRGPSYREPGINQAIFTLHRRKLNCARCEHLSVFRGGCRSNEHGVGARHDHMVGSKMQPVARRSHESTIGDLCNRPTERKNLSLGFLHKRLKKRATPHDRLHSSR